MNNQKKNTHRFRLWETIKKKKTNCNFANIYQYNRLDPEVSQLEQYQQHTLTSLRDTHSSHEA